jgi:hypothetical protein
MPLFQVFRGLKSCTSLLENVTLRFLPSNLQEFSVFCACPSNKHCPSARCAYAANVVGKDLDIFALGGVYLNYINTNNLHRMNYYYFIIITISTVMIFLLIIIIICNYTVLCQ